MKSKVRVIALISILAIFSTLQVFAQSDADLSPPDLKGSIPQLPPPPVPVDENGNPNAVLPPTPEQIETQRLDEVRRAEVLRFEEETRIAEENRHAEDERRYLESQAEQKRFHDRVMWAIYMGLGLLAVFVGSRLFKKKD
ncbi:MAG: hypothetical protein ABIP02_01455 [Arenimonas sp.]